MRREVIYMNDSTEYHVEDLYNVSPLALICPMYRPKQQICIEDNLFNGQAIDWLRNILLPQKLSVVFPKRIFLSRHKASGLRKFNEEECIEMLKNLGFEVVFPEDYSILEQVTLFNEAEFIIGGSGAAFTNLIYASEATSAIILEGYRSNIGLFSSLSTHVGFDLVYIYSKEKGIIPSGYEIHENFSVDLFELQNLVQKMLSYRNVGD